MERSHHRAERFYVMLTLGIVAGILFLVAAIWGGHELYVRWQERRFVNLAAFAMAHGDIAKANLAVRTLLQMNPSSAAGARLMADLAEKAEDKSAIEWRSEVVRLQPKSSEDAIAWVRTALHFNDVPTAERVLAGIKGDAKQTAGYHAVLALLAQAKQQPEKIEAEWSEAVRLAPQEKRYRFELGLVWLHSSDASRHAEGKKILEAFRTDPEHRAAATRELIKDGVVRRQDSHEVLNMARELQAYPEATMADRFQYLGFLRQLQDPQFASYLSELEKNALKNPNDLFSLLSWMSSNNLNLLALDFFKTLPAEEREKWPLPFALADLRTRLADWPLVERDTKNANWGNFEFLRHAYLARTFRAQGKDALVEREWSAAQRDAAGNSESIALLLRLTTEWGWQNEKIELLWTLSKFPDKQTEAFTALYRHYVAEGDTSGLYRLTSRMAELRPDDPFLKNNLAQLSLLLDRGLKKANEVAKGLHNFDPKNAAFASTYAYSLFLQKKHKEALQAMSMVDPADLKKPEIAAYYGIILAAAGEKEKAREYLEIGKQGRLFPEEKALVERAEKL